MNIIRAEKVSDTPAFLREKISPTGPLPEGSLIRDYGIDTLRAGHGSDLHYHDCDEWWVILEGHARISWGEQVDEAFPGDMIFTPKGVRHAVEAVADMKLIWLEGPLQGKRRSGHLRS
jgi:mannose-6-phosphate isomerase-like protein (cupin superfamily)